MNATGAIHDLPADVPGDDERSGSPAGTLRRKSDPVPSESGQLRDVSLRWSDVGLFVACYVGLVAVWFALGEFVENTSAITSLDESIAEWWVDQRTPDRTTAALWGAGLAETFVKIAVTALIAIAMKLAWKRWREPLMMVVPLVLEAAAFITVTHLVGRPRPENGLESSPVDSSFPSGHVAAAAAYSAIVIIVFWHTRKVWIRAFAIVISALIPIVVAVSRMYQGMHFLSDVIAGAALGVASVALSWWLIRRAIDRNDPDRSDPRVIASGSDNASALGADV